MRRWRRVGWGRDERSKVGLEERFSITILLRCSVVNTKVTTNHKMDHLPSVNRWKKEKSNASEKGGGVRKNERSKVGLEEWFSITILLRCSIVNTIAITNHKMNHLPSVNRWKKEKSNASEKGGGVRKGWKKKSGVRRVIFNNNLAAMFRCQY